MKDEFLVNYMALLACIISECSSEVAIKSILLSDKASEKTYKRIQNCKKLGKSKGVKTKVVNIKTGEEWVFNSGVEAGVFLGTSRSVVPDYLRTNKVYKGVYRFEKVE